MNLIQDAVPRSPNKSHGQLSAVAVCDISFKIHIFCRILDSESCRSAEAVVITYASLLIVVSIAGDINLYSYDPAIFLIPEMDGIRILTNSCHEMIQKVPKCVNNIFAINSQEPSSWLFEAHKKYVVGQTCDVGEIQYSQGVLHFRKKAISRTSIYV